jgi:hypothetical protein
MMKYNDIKIGDIVVTTLCDSGEIMVGHVVDKEEYEAGKVVCVKFGFEKKPYRVWVEDYLAEKEPDRAVHNSHEIIRVVGNILSEKDITATFPLEPETVDVYLSEEHTPIAFREAVIDLMNSGIDDSEAAKRIISETPITLEVAYSLGRGLFAVDSDAVASLGNDLFDPYTGGHVIVQEEEEA